MPASREWWQHPSVLDVSRHFDQYAYLIEQDIPQAADYLWLISFTQLTQ